MLVCQQLVDADHAVGGLGDQGLGGVLAEAIEEVSQEQEGCAVMRSGLVGIGGPVS